MGWEKCEEDAQANTRSFKVLVWIKETSSFFFRDDIGQTRSYTQLIECCISLSAAVQVMCGSLIPEKKKLESPLPFSYRMLGGRRERGRKNGS